MKPFAFRQRVGDVNWRAVSSVDVERIIDDNKIEELQSIIDDVTFCDVKSSDIKGNTIHSTKKFVHLMQLMLEYLLYCQESQLQLIQDLHKKNHHMKSQNKLIAQKNESAKEDIRIYRRQITMMKESIKNLNVKDKTVEHPPRVFDPLHRDGKSDSSSATAADALNPIIDSMLQHERETRNFVKDIITEQRHSFLSEFEKISKNVQSTERTGGSSLTRQDIERQLQSNMDMILSELRKSQFARQDSVDSNKENMDVMERERKSLREHERKVERREDKVLATEERVRILALLCVVCHLAACSLTLYSLQLSQMEKELHDRTHDLDMRAAAALALDSSSRSGQQAPVAQRSVGVNTPAAEEEAADQPSSAILGDIAVNILRRVFRRGALLMMKYFSLCCSPIASFWSLQVQVANVSMLSCYGSARSPMSAGRCTKAKCSS